MPGPCNRCCKIKPAVHWYHGDRPRLVGLCRDCALHTRTIERRIEAAGGDYAGPLSLRRLAAEVEVHETDHMCGGGPLG